MKKKIQTLSSSFFKSESYTQNLLYILSSKIIITILVFVTTPVITRLYHPQDYGYFSLLNSILLNVILLSNLSLPFAFIVAKKRIQSELFSTVLLTTFIISIFLTALLFFFSERINIFLTYDINRNLYLFIPLLGILYTSTEVFANSNIGNKRFRRNAIVNMSEVISVKSSSIIFGIAGFNQLGLIISEILGKSINLGVQLLRKPYFPFIRWRFKSFKIIRLFKEFPRYQMPVNFINRFSGQFIIWMFAFYFTTIEIGIFTMAVSLLSIPLTLLANSLQPIITKKVEEIKRNEKYPTLQFRKIILLVFLLAVVVYAIIALLADFLVLNYLGGQWTDTIIPIKILCFSFIFLLIGHSLSGVFIIIRKQKQNLILKLIFSLALVLSIISLGQFYSITFVNIMICYSVVIGLEEFIKIIYLYKSV